MRKLRRTIVAIITMLVGSSNANTGQENPTQESQIKSLADQLTQSGIKKKAQTENGPHCDGF